MVRQAWRGLDRDGGGLDDVEVKVLCGAALMEGTVSRTARALPQGGLKEAVKRSAGLTNRKHI